MPWHHHLPQATHAYTCTKPSQDQTGHQTSSCWVALSPMHAHITFNFIFSCPVLTLIPYVWLKAHSVSVSLMAGHIFFSCWCPLPCCHIHMFSLHKTKKHFIHIYIIFEILRDFSYWLQGLADQWPKSFKISYFILVRIKCRIVSCVSFHHCFVPRPVVLHS